EPGLRDLLVRSAFLREMTGPLVDRLLDRSGSARLLARLKRDNFFITEYGGAAAPLTYRFHPLFREFLLARAHEQIDAAEGRRLRGGGGESRVAAGDAEAALELFLEGGDHQPAARLALGEAPRLLAQGRGRTVVEWVQRLPATVVATNPWLALAAAS